MMKMIAKEQIQNVLVLGGRGFIGRYAVKHLRQLGANVIIGTRNTNFFKKDKQEKYREIAC